MLVLITNSDDCGLPFSTILRLMSTKIYCLNRLGQNTLFSIFVKEMYRKTTKNLNLSFFLH